MSLPKTRGGTVVHLTCMARGSKMLSEDTKKGKLLFVLARKGAVCAHSLRVSRPVSNQCAFEVGRSPCSSTGILKAGNLRKTSREDI